MSAEQVREIPAGSAHNDSPRRNDSIASRLQWPVRRPGAV